MLGDIADRIVDFLARHALGIFGGLGVVCAFYTSAVVFLAYSVRLRAGRYPRWMFFGVLQPYSNPEDAYRRPFALLFAIMAATVGILILLCIVLVR